MLPTTENRVTVVTGHAIAAGLRELADEIQWNHDLATAMHIEYGPTISVHLDNRAEVEAFATRHNTDIIGAPVEGVGSYISATAHLEGLRVTVWTRVGEGS